MADRGSTGRTHRPATASGAGRRRWPRRLAVGSLATVAGLAVAIVVALWFLIQRPFPDHAGQASLRGLEAPVEVHRDAHGVPHLIGAHDLDLYRAQGYVHAQDRFWQMDTWRHITAGRTAELFGPSQLSDDAFLRTLGWHRAAAADLEILDGHTRAVLEAYAAGVNAYLEEHPPRGLALGYSVLRLTGLSYAPEPWEPVDTLAFLRLMAWDLGGNADAEIERAVLTRHLGDDKVPALFPPYPDDAPTIVGDEAAAASDSRGRAADPLAGQDVGDPLARVAERLDDLSPLVGVPAEGLGSNAWVVHGDRTASGAPILANDTHLGVGMPSIWYEVGLRCPTRGPGCDNDVAGFGFAGVPGVIVGHNDEVAWGVTNLGPDVQDLYIERLHPEDPHRYEVEGQWREAAVRTETLRAADGSEETLEVVETRNGPVISERYGPVDELEPLDEDAGEYAVSLRWTALEASATLRAVLGINAARDLDAFREALTSWDVPAQSFVYADRGGTIAYLAPGRIPVRSEAHDGTLPAPGWDDAYQWEGVIPDDELPFEVDPDRGWIVTANHAVVGEEHGRELRGDWDRGFRARRIIELVDGAASGVDVDLAVSHQLDTRNLLADELVDDLLAVDDVPADVATIQGLLADWDRDKDADSAAAAAYAATWKALLAEVFAAQLPERYAPVGNSRWFEVVRRLLDDPDSSWWRDAGGQQEALASAMDTAHADLTARLGDDPSQWTWGALHTATFAEGTLGSSGIGLVEDRFNRGPYEVGGGASIVNATSWDASEGYEVTALPSKRFVVDLADLDATRTIHTTGQSGHPYHRHYDDMVQSWQDGDHRAAVFDLDAIAARSEDVLELHPPAAP